MTSSVTLTVLGLMSGTSMDGIDACAAQMTLCLDAEIPDTPMLTALEVLHTASLSYEPALKQRLMSLLPDPVIDLKTLCELERDVGQSFGVLAKDVVEALEAKGISVDAVASHGQTVYHLPPEAPQNGFSLQLGSPDAIAAACNRTVIAQFRNTDMAYGGQGAPLVPFVDKVLFQHLTQWQAAHNLGGISNITVIPPHHNPEAKTLGFDTGPANGLIDALAQKHFNTPYDQNGDWARSGRCDEAILCRFLADAYFAKTPPKSTGREYFNLAFLERDPAFMALSPHDQLRTALELTVSSIEDSYRQLIGQGCGIETVVMSGGGTRNAFLMQRLRDVLGPLGVTLKTQLPFDIPSQSKEALAFAVLGAMTLLGYPNTLPSVTGASCATSGGAIWRYDLLSEAVRTKMRASRPD